MMTENEVVDVRDLKNVKAKKQLPGLCREYREIASQISELETAKSLLRDSIRELAEKTGHEKIQGEGWRLVKSKGRKSLSKEKLVENGVDVETIQASYVEGRAFWSVR